MRKAKNMGKKLTALTLTFLFGTLFLNAQVLEEKIFKQMKKDANGSCFSCEEGLPENTLCYFNKKGDEIGTININKGVKRLAYKINETDSIIMYFDSTNALFKADYKRWFDDERNRRYLDIAIDTAEQRQLYEIFGPVLNQ